MSASYVEYKSKDWIVNVRVPTPQLEHPQLAQSPEQEQVEQPQGDILSMGGLMVVSTFVYCCWTFCWRMY